VSQLTDPKQSDASDDIEQEDWLDGDEQFPFLASKTHDSIS
jgi:hypothetical protein